MVCKHKNSTVAHIALSIHWESCLLCPYNKSPVVLESVQGPSEVWKLQCELQSILWKDGRAVQGGRRILFRHFIIGPTRILM